MAQSLVVNGVAYSFPDVPEEDWGQNVTDWAVAVTQNMLQRSGGTFTLGAEVDFGATYGLASAYFKSRTSNPASAGAVRLARADEIKWRNQANGADLTLGVNASNQLTYEGIVLDTSALVFDDTATVDFTTSGVNISAIIVAGSIANSHIATAAAIAYSKLNLAGSIVNADVATAAAIALSKLAVLTVSRAVQTNAATGFLEASTVTNTELGYVSGVTSALQTQLNAKADGTNQPVNILVNGGMEIWQRGTSFSSPATGAYTADRWQVEHTSPPTFTISRSTVVEAGHGTYCMRVNITAVGAATYCTPYQIIENPKNYQGRTITLSARVWSNVAGQVAAVITDSASSTVSTYHPGNSTWQTLTVTRTIDAGATSLKIWVGPWSSAAISDTYIDSVMLVLGSTATPFVPMHPADDLARCQRYYETSGTRLEQIVTLMRTGAIPQAREWTAFAVPKAVAATITLTKGSIYPTHGPTTGNGAGAEEAASWTASASGITTEGFQYVLTRSSDLATYPVLDWINSSWIAEANP